MSRREILKTGLAGLFLTAESSLGVRNIQAPEKMDPVATLGLTEKTAYYQQLEKTQGYLDSMPFLAPATEYSQLFGRPYGINDRFSYATGEFIWPTPVDHLVSTRFFYWHPGIDVVAELNEPVRAMDGGKVLGAEWNTGGYGYHTIVNHGSGLFTLYAHLASFAAKAGDMVRRGDILGGAGSTGRSSGTHLHFEILQLSPSSKGVVGEAINPLVRMDVNKLGIKVFPSFGGGDAQGPFPVVGEPINCPPRC